MRISDSVCNGLKAQELQLASNQNVQTAVYCIVLLDPYLYNVATDLLLQVCEVQNQGNDRDSHKGASSVKVKLAFISVCRQMLDIIDICTCSFCFSLSVPM